MTDGLRVLLVDDNRDHRLLLSAALSEGLPGAEVREATGLAEALERLATERFSVVLCDSSVGDATGLDLLRAARAHGLEPPFLLVTRHGSEDIAREAFLEGVTDYLTKETALRSPQLFGRKIAAAADRGRLAAERHRAEAILEGFLENNPFGILIFDFHGNLIRWNQALGTHGASPLPRSGAYSPLEDDQLRATGVLEKIREAAKGSRVELGPFLWDPERAGFSGAPRVLRGVAFPIPLGDETPHVCAMLQDITAEETARRECDEYAAILASLLNATQAAIYFVDPDQGVRFANRYVEEFFGIDPTTVVGRPAGDLAARIAATTPEPEDFLARSERLNANLAAETADAVETVRPQPRHLHRYSGPVRGQGGRFLGRIDVYRDETAAVQRQQGLEAQNRELDAFASRLAHDLKTPLVSLRGFADLLTRQPTLQLDDRARSYLDKVRASATLLSEMVDGLRDLSLARRPAPSPDPTDPLPVLRLAGETLSAQAEAKGVEISLPAAAPTVACDRAKVFQVFQNLIANAILYSDPQKPERWVQVRVEGLDSTPVFVVADNGRGIAEDDLHQLFQPFRRGRNSAGAPGMGLGLAIVQRLLEASGGRIAVKSRPGEGTTCTVTLPGAGELSPNPASS